MGFLRLGTACAVFDVQGRILLSRRGDLDVWNLPTGRLDSGELLIEAAAREAYEETGVKVDIKRAVGLYYYQATQRLNVLFAGVPVGGEVVSETDESTDNQYFALDALPENLFASYMVHHAANDKQNVLYIHITPQWEIFKLRFKLARRWLVNYLSGRPEPQHVRFHITAACVIFDETHEHVLVDFPHVLCTGEQSPWYELSHNIKRQYGIEPDLYWIGIAQQPEKNAIEFVFATTLNASTLSDDVNWIALTDSQSVEYIQHIKPTYPNDPIWTIVQEQGLNT